MKKKVLAALLCVAMTATLFAGCGSDDANNDSSADANNDASGTEAQADPGDAADDVADAANAATGDLADANVAVFYYTYSDTYIASVRTALDAKLDEMGVKYQDYDSNSNQTTMFYEFFQLLLEDYRGQMRALSYGLCSIALCIFSTGLGLIYIYVYEDNYGYYRFLSVSVITILLGLIAFMIIAFREVVF